MMSLDYIWKNVPVKHSLHVQHHSVFMFWAFLVSYESLIRLSDSAS